MLRKSGKTTPLSQEVTDKIIAALKEGYVHKSIAEEYLVSLSSVQRINRQRKENNNA